MSDTKSLFQPFLVFTNKQLRYTHEVFTSASLKDKVAFLKGLELLKAKGFQAEIKEFPLTDTICVTVVKLKSPRAEAYAMDLIRKGMKEQGFIFPYSTQRS